MIIDQCPVLNQYIFAYIYGWMIHSADSCMIIKKSSAGLRPTREKSIRRGRRKTSTITGKNAKTHAEYATTKQVHEP